MYNYVCDISKLSTLAINIATYIADNIVSSCIATSYLAMIRLAPIMLLKLPIMFWSNAPIFFLLCSNYAP